MLKGKIALYDSTKKQGYVRLPETREEFHFRVGEKDSDAGLEPGGWVLFRIVQDKKGYTAKDVQPLYLM